MSLWESLRNARAPPRQGNAGWILAPAFRVINGLLVDLDAFEGGWRELEPDSRSAALSVVRRLAGSEGVMATGASQFSMEQLLEHEDFVRELARHLIHDPHRTDDLAQQTFLAAMQRPPGHARGIRTWLRRVLANFARQELRSDARRGRREAGRLPRAGIPAAEEILDFMATTQ